MEMILFILPIIVAFMLIRNYVAFKIEMRILRNCHIIAMRSIDRDLEWESAYDDFKPYDNGYKHFLLMLNLLRWR
jgi:hypothetical protein